VQQQARTEASVQCRQGAACSVSSTAAAHLLNSLLNQVDMTVAEVGVGSRSKQRGQTPQQFPPSRHLETGGAHQAHGSQRHQCHLQPMAAQHVVAALHILEGDGRAAAVVYTEGGTGAEAWLAAAAAAAAAAGGCTSALPRRRRLQATHRSVPSPSGALAGPPAAPAAREQGAAHAAPPSPGTLSFTLIDSASLLEEDRVCGAMAAAAHGPVKSSASGQQRGLTGLLHLQSAAKQAWGPWIRIAGPRR